MRRSDVAELLVLAALWGGAFLLMRIGAGDFGAVPLAAVRATGGAALLLPLLVMRGETGSLRRHWRPIFTLGIVNSVVPSVCFTYAALSITAGMSAIFNSASPLFGALIGWWWLREGLSRTRVAGLAIGFAGVLWLAWDGASFKAGGSAWAIGACLLATVCYGWSANHARLRLRGVPPLAVAGGSQLVATLVLAVPAAIWWPEHALPAASWAAAGVLAFACTGFAFILYFRRIANAGPVNAIAVTFLIPAFAVAWGWAFLGEGITPTMIAGCATILAGTALATGLVKLPLRRHAVAG